MGFANSDTPMGIAAPWFDSQMKLLEPFDVTLTYCFTPERCGIRPLITPARHISPEGFADFGASMTPLCGVTFQSWTHRYAA